VRSFRNRLCAVILLLAVLVGCNAPKPTPAQGPTPKPTVTPVVTAGPLVEIDIDKPRISVRVPSTWKISPPLNENSIVLSPTGSADTSTTAGPFLLITVDNSAYFHSRLSFPAGLTNPVQQLDALINAMNRDGPQFDPATPYSGSTYPAAITRGFERDNELTIVLMNAGNDRWIYVGAQASEKTFGYFEGTVFTPAINSITLKSP
jgi:hypothetical protein